MCQEQDPNYERYWIVTLRNEKCKTKYLLALCMFLVYLPNSGSPDWDYLMD